MTNRNDIQYSMHVLAMTHGQARHPHLGYPTHTPVAPVQRIPTTLPLRAYDPVIIPVIITRPPPGQFMRPSCYIDMLHVEDPQLHRYPGWAGKELRGSRRQS